MLESPYPPTSYENLKCGEIFCVSPPLAVFHVTCTSCDQKINFDEFVEHFQAQHLPLAEETIILDDLVAKPSVKLEEDVILENIFVTKEVPGDDLVNQEDFSGAEPTKIDVVHLEEIDDRDCEEAVENEEDDVCVQESTKESKKRPKRKNGVTRKSLARNAKKTTIEKVTGNDQKDVETISHCDEKEIDLNIEAPFLNVEKLVVGDDDDDDYDWPAETELLDKIVEPEPVKNPIDELQFKCPLCPRSYITKHALQKHHYSAHNPNKWDGKSPKPENKCDICQEVFRSAPMLRTHKYKHTGIICDICGKPFRQVGSMVRHKIRHTGVKEHKCKECPKDFFTAKELKSHMICHNGMQVVCEVCGKRCRDGGDLTVHMRRHTGERPAKCNVCGKSFFTSHDLNVHAIGHTTDRPFSCEICGSRFQRKKAMRIHKRIHSKVRNHECKICGKGFVNAGGLNSHMRSHEAALEKPNEDVYIPTIFIGKPPCLNLDNPEICGGGSMSSTTSEVTISANVMEEEQFLASFIV